MDVEAADWLIDAPIPCPKCGKEAVAKLAILKARNSICCRYCGTAIDLTDPRTRAYVEQLSGVVGGLLSGSDQTQAVRRRVPIRRL
jgi:transcription elongation factor Elf1